MIRKILLIAVLSLIGFSGYSQDLAGRKIINGNFFLNVASSKGTNSLTQFNTSLLMGKIKEDNSYWAYGGRISIVSGGVETYSIGPEVERGKFIKMVDKLYFAPYGGAYVQGLFGDLKGFNAAIYVSPLRFMYHFSNNFMLSATLGSASMQFNKLNDLTNFNISGSMTNSSGFGVFYTFK